MSDFWGLQTKGGKAYLLWFGEKAEGGWMIHAIPESGADLCGVVPEKDPKVGVEWFTKHKGTTTPVLRPRLLRRGQRHPRIWRGDLPTGPNEPLESSSPPHDGPDGRAFLSTGTAAASLFRSLERVFHSIHPTRASSWTYGQELRQLLILACTEVESAWKGILRANGYPGDRLDTKDYVKLRDPLKLPAWTLRLTFYPEYPTLRPFDGWESDRPTKSLPWYDAYNTVKHDGEDKLTQATLANLISACAALLILAVAQFGYEPWLDTLPGPFAQGLFTLAEGPSWDAGERYFPALRKTDWEYVPYPF